MPTESSVGGGSKGARKHPCGAGSKTFFMLSLKERQFHPVKGH